MEKFKIYEALQIRYVKLYFTIVFPTGAVLPVNKVSALRGGMGEMLLRANCIRDRCCEHCDFESECIVRRTMYSKFMIKPAYVTNGESVGYVLECENDRTEFPSGGMLDFQLILFGRTIVYLNQYLQAFYTLGLHGLGTESAKFQIVSLKNTYKQDILVGTDIFMKNYKVANISDYVRYRLEKIDQNGMEQKLVFKTPTTLKYKNEFLQEFQMEAILNAVKRRIFMLCCFEGIQTFNPNEIIFPMPEIIRQEYRFVQVKRYSSRKKEHMILKGIEGFVQLDKIPEEALLLLLAGELIHIGKNTSFGFGRYQVK